MKFTFVFVVALVAAASAQKVITKNGWTRTELLDVSSLINEANNVNRDERDACVKFVSSNNGYSFKAAQPEDSNAVCLNQCDDGRDCYTVVGGCDEGCQYCVRAFTCADDEEKGRCEAIEECQCGLGEFKCVPSNSGIRFKKGPKPDEVPEDGELDGTSPNGYFFLFQKLRCEVEDTFNLIPCTELNKSCRAFEPCVSEDMSCCQVLPGAPLPTSSSSSTTSPEF